DGTTRQKLLLAGLVGLYAFGVLIASVNRLDSLGEPDLGWHLSWTEISPTRQDAAASGLRGGGRPLEINGRSLDTRSIREDILPGIRWQLGEHNVLRVKPAGRPVRELSIPVRERRFDDLLYAHGATLALGTLFFVVGFTTFVLRPWETSSWALLSLCVACGGSLWTLLPEMSGAPLEEGYRRSMVGLGFAAVWHASVAFPSVHPLLLRGPAALIAIYAAGIVSAFLQLHAWRSGWQGVWQYQSVVNSGLLLIALTYFIGRCAALALRSQGLVAQRARILLAGALFGAALPVAVRFVQLSFGRFEVDTRYAYWSLAFLLWALARSTLRTELLNARVAAQRAAVYGMAVVGLTALAVVLSRFSPYLVALLLLPLLYIWPLFEARLNARFYPKRSQLPELVRGLGEDLSTASSVQQALEVISRGAARVFDARSSAAFLSAGVAGEEPRVGSWGVAVAPEPALEKEPLIQVMAATRQEVQRDQIAVEPQYARIRDDSYACLDRLDAELLVPVTIEGRVVGGLAMGERTTGDHYERFHIEVLHSLIQGMVRDIRRIEASERLQEREREFSDLKRFFPPPIIERIMAEGGTAELRSQRRRVTVFFADLRGFTAFSERREPEEVVATLADYHSAMGARIGEFEGTLERFVGDGFMVFFNDPVEQSDHVERAARMALAMLGDVADLRSGWERLGYAIDVGMGIATGYATVGFIGYEGRRDYAVIGSVTNLASRLSDQAGPGEILVTPGVRVELPAGIKADPAGEFQLAGFSQPQSAYRLLAG
ncbi:MAG: adenylate/guanylate cyclase domain-containing protein, partial [Proteobacteria bacterium]|nr:adenylate/guanylate cyclase domain-containing protein [Pseudomonadota bacterium]